MSMLVTGATGFIGNYVVRELLANGHEVIATSANADKASRMEWYDKVIYRELHFDHIHPGVNYFEYFDNPAAIIHLAWEGLPNYKSLFHFEINLPRHYFFLKNLVENGCRNVTVTGTCFEYGMKNGCLSEDMQTEPANPYALAKDTLNKFLYELSKNDPFTLKWVRLFYLFGKGKKNAQKKIPIFAPKTLLIPTTDGFQNLAPMHHRVCVRAFHSPNFFRRELLSRLD